LQGQPGAVPLRQHHDGRPPGPWPVVALSRGYATDDSRPTIPPGSPPEVELPELVPLVGGLVAGVVGVVVMGVVGVVVVGVVGGVVTGVVGGVECLDFVGDEVAGWPPDVAGWVAVEVALPGR
jgi:hypothetical protein